MLLSKSGAIPFFDSLLGGVAKAKVYCATKILVIGDGGDDQLAQRAAISSAEPGWQLDFCDTGQAAVKEVASLQPHCIILDSQLPDMSALECFRAIRSLPGSTTPVLMLAAQDNQWNAAEALNLGVQDYLFKDARGNYLALLPAVVKKTLREHRVALEQRSAQDAMSALWRRFELMFCDLSDGIVLANEQRAIESINPAACRIFGYDAPELYGRSMEILVHPLDHLRYRQELDTYSNIGCGKMIGQGTHDIRGIGKGGKLLALEVSVTEIGFDGRRFFACVVRESAPQRAAEVEPSVPGVAGRANFMAAIGRLLRARTADAPTHSLMLLRLGRFEEASRECGRVAGNQLSRQVSALLTRHTRKSDRLGRLGNGEFGLLLEECQAERAIEIAAKLIDAVRSFGFEWDGRRFKLDLGIGVAAIDGRTADVGMILDAASRACDMAANSGSFRIHVLDEVGRQRALPGMQSEWIGRLRRAIDRDELQLFFQRVFPLGKAEARPHFEVLLRYRDEDGGVHLPQDFIPAAERHGMLAAIDRWVLGRVLRNPAPVILLQEPGALVSINLSGAALADRDFRAFALRELKASKLPPDRLCFEISEASAIGNFLQAVEFIRALKHEGYRFALDDFDGGLSSFTYLNSLPVDYLKMNGDVANDPAARTAYYATVESVHRIAGGMGIATIAKSVETDADLLRLRSLGIEYAQGYGLHAPEPLFPVS